MFPPAGRRHGEEEGWDGMGEGRLGDLRERKGERLIENRVLGGREARVGRGMFILFAR
jgi:hypothetical protein